MARCIILKLWLNVRAICFFCQPNSSAVRYAEEIYYFGWCGMMYTFADLYAGDKAKI